jgi:flagellar hook-associated protein 3 FlgL
MRISTHQMFNQGLTNILKQQEVLARTQQQLATGKRILTPSDDPIASSRIELMNQRISMSERMLINKETAETTLAIEEGLLSNSVSTVHKLRDLQVQAGNGALSQSQRQSIAKESQVLLEQLVGIANFQDNNGHYMFSGGQTLTQAISQNSGGNYVYNGDETTRKLSVANGLSVQLNDSAKEIFMRIANGNGRFSVSDNGAANMGSGVISTGSVIDESAYVSDDYTISFALNSSSELVVMVSGASSGNLIPPSGLVDDAPLYIENQSINFNGIDITVKGQPNAGDDFLVQPATSESLFSTVSRMIANLNSSTQSSADKARIESENNQVLSQLDNAIDNIVNVQAEIGARLNVAEIAGEINNDFILTSKQAVSELEDLNIAEAAVNLNYQTIILQAAQQSYTRIQGLSLFNYL